MELVNVEPLLLDLGRALRSAGLKMATAESCTGGLIAATCTAVAGSSDWFERGFVTYSNAAKTDLLGVPDELLRSHGAVSEAVAMAMAAGALSRSPVQRVVAVTGIAGPGGAVAGKPVGTVWLALACADSGHGATVQARLLQFGGDRGDVRWATVVAALQAVRQSLP